jgi:hypothetical protein
MAEMRHIAGSQDVVSFSACDGLVSDKRGRAGPDNYKDRRGGSKQMDSIWWVLVAFWAGGCAGVLVMALMQMAAGLPEQSAPRSDLNEVPR